ncbi:MAG: YaeQ family protein [Planctomycetes bacterium]|nr:YaeQ family protein [Planctomycetota bacterium]
MSTGSLLYGFDIELSDVDRGVYDTLALRVPCHASETPQHLLARVLAFCLEATEGLAFGRGLAEPDEPALTVRDLTGALQAWIDVGSPDAARLHRAAKAAPRVAVYTHKDPGALLRQLAGERIHRAADIRIHAFDRALLDALAARLQRRMAFALAVNERHLYVTLGGEVLSGEVHTHALDDG